MRIGIVLGAFLWAVILSLTGCGAGYKIGAEVGLYRVDEQSSSNTTHRRADPLMCSFFPSYCKRDIAEEVEK